MKSYYRFILILASVLTFSLPVKSQVQAEPDTSLYLITCGPGTETYSIYGHSALLVTIGSRDTVYNWGVFNFDVPNFGWNFAKGNLDYWLDDEPLNRFLRSYFYEQRYVISQRINLTPSERRKMLELVEENLKPENVKYRYDFFYDNCSTRIRDLIEKSVSGDLIYPEDAGEMPTFRELIGEYQQYTPWTQFGIDLLIGANAEKKADIRAKMFLPEYLMKGLSAAVVKNTENSKLLLSEPRLLLDFAPPAHQRNFFSEPFFILSLFFVFILLISFLLKNKVHHNMLDFMLFFIFSLLAVLMVFFNFFTGHEQLRANYNILWLNPFIIVFFFSVLAGKGIRLWAWIVFITVVIFILIHFFLPQSFNVANYPLYLLILLRTMVRSDFIWSPVRIST